ncbi:MAG: DUF4388 domain-containing protein [Chloroflexi bacterium]|nr:DUF4388 domain-containing protein [Chloroflexota bacterium]
MALKGNLRDFSTTQLLNLINLARKTGTLTIEGPTEAAQMSFKEGKLIYARLGGEDGTLADILHRAGKLSEEQARALRRRAETAGDKELGLLLINAGYVSQSDIIQSIRQHVVEIVYRLFTWVEGVFRFEASVLPPEDKITVPVELENIILEGARRLREWEHLQDEIPSLDMALKFTDRPNASVRDVNLSVEEWRVVSFINPKNTIRQIARANKLSDLETRKIVYGLLQAGLVELIRPVGETVRPPGAPPGAKPPVVVPAGKPAQKSLINRLISRIRSL